MLDVSVSAFKKNIFYNCFQLCYGKHCKMHFREEGPVNSGMDSICVDVGCTAQPAPAVWSNWCSSRVEIRQAPFVFHFLFSFFLNNILSKNKVLVFFSWSLLEPLICPWIKYSFETSVLCQVKIGMTQGMYFLGEWGSIMIRISYIVYTWCKKWFKARPRN